MNKILLLLSTVILSITTMAQIPNAGFESWTGMTGYSLPNGWGNLNMTTASMSMYTCSKGAPGYTGFNYLKLTSKTMGSMGVIPGIAVSGVLDSVTMQPVSGFPDTARSNSLTGEYQFMDYGGDDGYISVLLSKWNAAMGVRDTVAYTRNNLPAMIMIWASFTVPITYMSGESPDSAIIVLSASGATPVNNSYLYVDNLSFSGYVPSGVNNTTKSVLETSVFPNPAVYAATIVYTAHTNGNANIKVADISGKIVLNINNESIAGENKFVLNTSGYSKGLYFVTITDGTDIQVEQLIVQ